jgi:polyphenol oxidase
MSMALWLQPCWTDPAALLGVGSVMSTRRAGVSVAPRHALNLGVAVGDDPVAVARNRQIFQQAIAAQPVWMRQVHGTRVVRLDAAHAGVGAATLEADACWTTAPGVACTVQVADCLPVLFSAPGGRVVGAAHAGWRGLAGGILQATVQQICAAAPCAPVGLQAWLGPCIGPRQFEVGADVRQAFAATGAWPEPVLQQCFRTAPEGKYLADLPGLARHVLCSLGVSRVSGGGWCTVEAPLDYFSFRRDGVTGRMAASVWIVR